MRKFSVSACGVELTCEFDKRRDEHPQIQRGMELMSSTAGRELIAVWTPAAKIRQVCSVTGGGDGERDGEGEKGKVKGREREGERERRRG